MDDTLVRLVTMTFRHETIPDFLDLFDGVSGQIRSQPGCKRLRLLRSLSDERVFTTYSVWDSEEDLNRYRSSPLFEATWERTRSWFEDRPVAVSYRIERTTL